MGKYARLLLTGCLLMTVLVPFSFASQQQVPEIESVADAINKAGRQRMLGERMLKAYCQVGLAVSSDKSRAEREDAVATFERQLRALQAFSTPDHDRLITALAKVESIWWMYKRLVASLPSKDRVLDLYYLGDELLHASDLVVQVLQDMADSPVGDLVNLSGRQRMLSQRLAKLYLMRRYGVDVNSVGSHIRRSSQDFETAMQVLDSAPQNTREIVQNLDKVRLQWEWFKQVLSEQDSHSEMIVINASEEILKQMEAVTSLYQELEQ